jgi:hypothetical protein
MTQPADDYTLADHVHPGARDAEERRRDARHTSGARQDAGECSTLPDLCTEVGAFDWTPPPDVTRAPIGIHDFNLNDGSVMVSDMVDALGTLLMGGNVDVGILGAAQIDRFGNLNTLVMGDYRAPERRLGGTGGNTEIACLAKRVITLMPQERRRFVPRVDFNTSPGYIDGPSAMRRLDPGTEPRGSTFGFPASIPSTEANRL